jgi:hypothetical protein
MDRYKEIEALKVGDGTQPGCRKVHAGITPVTDGSIDALKTL